MISFRREIVSKITEKDPEALKLIDHFVDLYEGLIYRLASSQADAYEGLEKILKRIFEFLNEPLLEGKFFHKELLEQAFYDLDSRPKIFPLQLKERLDELRGFSHVARHIYKLNLSFEKLIKETPKRLGILKEAIAEIDESH